MEDHITEEELTQIREALFSDEGIRNLRRRILADLDDTQRPTADCTADCGCVSAACGCVGQNCGCVSADCGCVSDRVSIDTPATIDPAKLTAALVNLATVGSNSKASSCD